MQADLVGFQMGEVVIAGQHRLDKGGRALVTVRSNAVEHLPGAATLHGLAFESEAGQQPVVGPHHRLLAVEDHQADAGPADGVIDDGAVTPLVLFELGKGCRMGQNEPSCRPRSVSSRRIAGRTPSERWSTTPTRLPWAAPGPSETPMAERSPNSPASSQPADRRWPGRAPSRSCPGPTPFGNLPLGRRSSVTGEQSRARNDRS
jgi:hypothetical protein